MNGHSIEKYFKIHSFSPGFKTKDKKVAAFSQTTNTDFIPVKIEDQSSHVNVPSIPPEQYNQLIPLLAKKKTIDTNDPVNSFGHALLAGKMCPGQWGD